MKKSLLSVLFVVAVSFKGFTQCTPDGSIVSPGIYPDSLPHATVGVAYSTDLQIKVPTDTTVSSIHLVIDTIKIIGASGLPAGYTYQCNPSASCVFLSGSNGCVRLSGPAPLAGQAGTTYQLYFYTYTSAHIFSTTIRYSQIDTVTRYHITVDNSSGVYSLSGNKFDVAQNIPNPFSKSTLIEFNSPTRSLVTLKVANMVGNVVSVKTFWADAGNNKLTFSAAEYAPGIYFYTIGTEKQAVTRRMIIGYE